MRHEILPDQLVLRQSDGAEERQQCPVAHVHARVRLRVVGRLLDQLQEQLVEQALLLHAPLEERLCQGDEPLLGAVLRAGRLHEAGVHQYQREILEGRLLVALRELRQRLSERDARERPVRVREALVAVTAAAGGDLAQFVSLILVQAAEGRAEKVALVHRLAENAAVDELFAAVDQALKPPQSILVRDRLLLLLRPVQVAEPVRQGRRVAHYERGNLLLVFRLENETLVVFRWRLQEGDRDEIVARVNEKTFDIVVRVSADHVLVLRVDDC